MHRAARTAQVSLDLRKSQQLCPCLFFDRVRACNVAGIPDLIMDEEEAAATAAATAAMAAVRAALPVLFLFLFFETW